MFLSECEDQSVWEGYGVLGGRRKNSAHGSEAAEFTRFGAGSRVGRWVLTTAASSQGHSRSGGQHRGMWGCC